jgi:6,7-dimethyl-8-ribityllumazine synthase
MNAASGAVSVALCVARFYEELADKLESGARDALAEAGIEEIDRFDVPGAFELPVAAKYAAQSGRYGAVVCLGAVIRGETDHYHYVCRESARGIQDVQLETGVPCGFGLLTVDSMEQALERVAGGSKRDTGRQAAQAALASLGVKQKLLGRRAATGFGASRRARRGASANTGRSAQKCARRPPPARVRRVADCAHGRCGRPGGMGVDTGGGPSGRPP